MSKVDTVFGPIPGPLIQEWGQPGTFVQTGTSTYDSTTGTITPTETRTPVQLVITKIDPTEFNGLYQATDVKILIDPGQIGGHYITTSDWFEVPKGAGTQRLKVIEPRTYRGDNPVFFVVIARPQ
jgi:cold shock CspA family protein